MANSASSNLARLRYIRQTVFGTVPSTGASKDIRFTGESLNHAIQKETSKEIRPDRQIADLVPVSGEVSGDIQFELSYGSFDDFIAAALGASAWSSDEVTNGIEVPFFSIEKGFTDINQHILYQDMAVNALNLDFSSGAIATGSLGFLGGKSQIASVSGLPAAGAAGAMTDVMSAAQDFGDLSIGGVSYDCGISAISLATDGGLRARRAPGNLGACMILPGTFQVTGSISVYFADASIYTKYLENTPFTLSWSVKDPAGNQYTFAMPKVKVVNAQVVAGGLDTDVALDIDYQALYDHVSDSTITITRADDDD